MTVPDDLAALLKAAGRKATNTRERAVAAERERDALIRQARDLGASLREIGELVGLSHTQVKNIAHGRADRRTNDKADDR